MTDGEIDDSVKVGEVLKTEKSNRDQGVPESLITHHGSSVIYELLTND